MEQRDSSCFYGIYKTLAELLGCDAAIIIHDNFSGQSHNFPKKLWDVNYIHAQIVSEYDGTNANQLASKYCCTYGWVLKLVKRTKYKR